MFVPFITKRTKRSESKSRRKLFRRKGGGGRGGGISSGGAGRGAGAGAGAGRGTTVSSGGQSRSVAPYAFGGGAAVGIPAGAMFAGRSIGGGNRNQVYGNQQYGSGYPNTAGRGVVGRGFPFGYWPIVWAGGAGYVGGHYLYNNHDEYGLWDNSSRPGGAQGFVSVASNKPDTNTVFRFLADSGSVSIIINDIRDNCRGNISNVDALVVEPYNDAVAAPKAEQVVQYYRASTAALTLDGYNNTAVLSDDENAPDIPLPSGIDMELLDCLNTTIGEAIPILSAAQPKFSSALPNFGLVGLAYVVWCLSSAI